MTSHVDPIRPAHPEKRGVVLPSRTLGPVFSLAVLRVLGLSSEEGQVFLCLFPRRIVIYYSYLRTECHTLAMEIGPQIRVIIRHEIE